MYNISYVSEVCTSHARAQKCVRVYLFEYTLIESCQMKSRANKWQFAEQANARVSECEREREKQALAHRQISLWRGTTNKKSYWPISCKHITCINNVIISTTTTKRTLTKKRRRKECVITRCGWWRQVITPFWNWQNQIQTPRKKYEIIIIKRKKSFVFAACAFLHHAAVFVLPFRMMRGSNSIDFCLSKSHWSNSNVRSFKVQSSITFHALSRYMFVGRCLSL